MTEEIIITCAVNGGSDVVLAEHPAIPKSPAEIYAAIVEAAEAGAAIAHLHVRDPVSGKASNDPALYAETMEWVRACGVDILLDIITSMASLVTLDLADGAQIATGTSLQPPQAQVQHALHLKPDIATIDCGVFGLGEAMFVDRPSALGAMAKLFQDAGIRPELKCFDFSHIKNARRLIDAGLISKPAFIQICLDTGYNAPDNAAALHGMRVQLPPGTVCAAFGCNRQQLALVPEIVTAGGHVRVGLEDTRVMPNGTLATNHGLVEAAAKIIHRMGRRPATVVRAREILALPEHGTQRPVLGRVSA